MKSKEYYGANIIYKIEEVITKKYYNGTFSSLSTYYVVSQDKRLLEKRANALVDIKTRVSIPIKDRYTLPYSNKIIENDNVQPLKASAFAVVNLFKIETIIEKDAQLLLDEINERNGYQNDTLLVLINKYHKIMTGQLNEPAIEKVHYYKGVEQHQPFGKVNYMEYTIKEKEFLERNIFKKQAEKTLKKSL